MPRRFLAALLLLGAAPAVAGLFDDDVARQRIVEQQQRIEQLETQHRDTLARIGKTEDALNQRLLSLFNQIEALSAEINRLQGQLEVLQNGIATAEKRQKDFYVDLDTRLRRLEDAAAAATVAATAAEPAPPTDETKAYEAAQELRKTGNYKGAAAAFQKFLAAYPKSTLAAAAQYWIGESQYHLKDYKSAIASHQKLIAGYPDSPKVPDAKLNMASALLELGNIGASRKTLEEIVAKHPTSEAADKAKQRLAVLKP